jgi:hypothetical protein
MGFNAGSLTAYLMLDTSQFDEAIASAEAKAEAFPKEIRTTIIADTQEADAAVAETAAVMDALDKQTAQPTASLDAAPFMAEAAAVEAEKGILEEPIDVTLRMNAKASEGEATALGESVGRSITQGVARGVNGESRRTSRGSLGSGARAVSAGSAGSNAGGDVGSLVGRLVAEGLNSADLNGALQNLGYKSGEIAAGIAQAIARDPAVAAALGAAEQGMATGIQDAAIATARELILGGMSDLRTVALGVQGSVGGSYVKALANTKFASAGIAADAAAAALGAAQAEALNAGLDAARAQGASIFAAIAAADAARAGASSGLSLPFTSLAGGALGAADPLGWSRSVPMGELGSGWVPRAIGAGMPAIGMGSAPMGELGAAPSAIPLGMHSIGPFAQGPIGSSTSTAMDLYNWSSLGEIIDAAATEHGPGGGGGGGSNGFTSMLAGALHLNGVHSLLGNLGGAASNFFGGGGAGGGSGFLGGLFSSGAGGWRNLGGFKQAFTNQSIPSDSVAGKWFKFLGTKTAKDNLLNKNILPKSMAKGIGKLGALPLAGILGGLSGVGPIVAGAGLAAAGGLAAGSAIAGAGSLGFALLAKNAYTNFSTAAEGQQQLQALGKKYGKNSSIYQMAAQQYATQTATMPAIAISTAAQAVPILNQLSVAFDKLSTPIYGVFLNFIRGLNAALPVLLPFLQVGIHAWTGFLNAISAGMSSKGFATFMKSMTAFEGPLMGSIAGIITNLAHAFASFVLLFAPIGVRLFKDLDNWTLAFAKFMKHVKFGPGFIAAMTTVGHTLHLVGAAIWAFIDKVGKATTPIGFVILNFVNTLAKYVKQFFTVLPANYATLLAGLALGLIAISKIGYGGTAVLAILLGLGQLMKILKINITPTEAKIITDIAVALTGLYLAAKLAATLSLGMVVFSKALAGETLAAGEASKAFGILGTAYRIFVGVLDTVGLAEYANPILAILGLLALAAIILITNWKNVGPNLHQYWTDILKWFDWGVNKLSPIINNGIRMINDLITAWDWVNKITGGTQIPHIPLLTGNLNQWKAPAVHHSFIGPTYPYSSSGSGAYGPPQPSKTVHVTVNTGASSADVHKAVASILPHIARAMG